MGRCKRIRTRRKMTTPEDNSLNRSSETIELKKWLKSRGFSNEPQLLLKEFKRTGRGVYCERDVEEGDFLIQIPYDLMITYTTLNSSDLVTILDKSKVKLELQDMLSLFLAIESKKSNSNWKIYIESLPNYKLPLCIGEMKSFEVLPGNLKEFSKRWRGRFEESWERVVDALQGFNYHIDFDLYKWAYTMVNTRAVYTNPDTVMEITRSNLKLQQYLIGEPSMALCPFLDMFNHENNAKTTVDLVKASINGKPWMYTLRTLTSYRKYKQIFINYGSHSNEKLWLEYGFFLTNNDFDLIVFRMNEDILTLSSADQQQYKFIKKNLLMGNLNISYNGLSFNLKALLYVLLNPDKFAVWSAIIFSDAYKNDDLIKINSLCARLLQNKLDEYRNDLSILQKASSEYEGLKCMMDFWMNTIDFVERTIAKY